MDIEHVGTTRAGKKSVVSIAVDSDSRPTLDELEVVSNDIGEILDDAEAAGALSFGAGYSLEVTTPGVDHPLTLPRHWRRNRGRLVKLTDEQGQKTLWRIGALNDAETHVIVVKHEGTSQAGTSQVRSPEVEVVPVFETTRAVVEIEFGKPSAAEAEVADETFETAVARREENK
ncbi:ribosome maturation protein RimP [Corynebacterium cystitidis DSM 20524]|uniref:Ribosome maturation factor RimP n=2 Tax=Corynebacterium cystitidis TaxID=35757 RepID=A0A1H9P1T6_9CORY|nr:ribosome maturation protein RimP [Corynebacterium cystitidis DSM 20524]SER42148.1 ribosome maturation factor RimP [Corynebacterium cystitidis DSM 20524]SNV72319.1 ribosome maturation protein RimP [Corynebacterium cystitidis]